MPQGTFSCFCAIIHLVHFHILLLDGAWVYRDDRSPRFQPVKPPAKSGLEDLLQLISKRVGLSLESEAWQEQDAERAWLELESVDDTVAMQIQEFSP